MLEVQRAIALRGLAEPAPDAVPARVPRPREPAPPRVSMVRLPMPAPPQSGAGPLPLVPVVRDADATQVIAGPLLDEPTAPLPVAVPLASDDVATGRTGRGLMVATLVLAVVAAASASAVLFRSHDGAGAEEQGLAGPSHSALASSGQATDTPSPASAGSPSSAPSPSASPHTDPVASTSPVGARSGVTSPTPEAAGPTRAPSPTKASPSVLTGRPNPTGRNLALDGTYTASSDEGDNWAPEFAFDGDRRTRWSSAFSDPQWIAVDLGDTWAVSDVWLYWERAYATRYHVDISLDGKTWSTVYTTTSGLGGTVRIGVGSPARYVRMFGTSRSGNYGYSLYEFQVR
jgi:hypothetical protein